MHTSSVVLGTDMLVVLEPGSKRFQALGTAPSQPGCTHARLGEKSSCEWAQRTGSAQGTGPSGLHGSAAMIGCFSLGQRRRPAYPSERGRPDWPRTGVQTHRKSTRQ